MAYTNKTTQTKNTIESSFLNLMKRKNFEAITINDIANESKINRSTFYLHYLDKYDLLEKIENRILDNLNDFHNSVVSNINPNSITKDFDLLDYINKDTNFFIIFENYLNEIKILLSSRSSLTFREKLSTALYETFKETFSLSGLDFEKTVLKLLLHYQVGGFISALEFWTDNKELKSEDLFLYYYSIMSNGVIDIVKRNMK